MTTRAAHQTWQPSVHQLGTDAAGPHAQPTRSLTCLQADGLDDACGNSCEFGGTSICVGLNATGTRMYLRRKRCTAVSIMRRRPRSGRATSPASHTACGSSQHSSSQHVVRPRTIGTAWSGTLEAALPWRAMRAATASHSQGGGAHGKKKLRPARSAM
eukprot:scaffold8160_cov126-Isochrysis_galbana.AAC.3